MLKLSILLKLVFLGLFSFSIGSYCVAAEQSSNGTINKTQAAKKAQQKVSGRVLKVEQNKSKYRVKVLQKSGRVVSVDVDKKSGKVSKQKAKD